MRSLFFSIYKYRTHTLGARSMGMNGGGHIVHQLEWRVYVFEMDSMMSNKLPKVVELMV